MTTHPSIERVSKYAEHVVDCCNDPTVTPEDRLHATWMLAVAVSRTIPNMTPSMFLFSLWNAEERITDHVLHT